MSKHFGGGRRLDSKDYPPPRRGVIEDKRPSVFDRLGVRKYEENLPSSHYAGGGGGADGGSYNRPPGHAHRKHSPLPMMARRRSQDARIRSRSRSRSFSPRSRKIPPADMGHHHGHGHGHMGNHGPGPGPMRRPKMKDISPHLDHRIRKRSSSPMRRKLDKPGNSGNSPKWRDEGLPPMSRQKGAGINPASGKKKGSGKRSGKKSTKEKKSGIKGRSSSGSSGTTGGTSSSSRSASSSSSSSEASSSTTSNATSTSDSSVPSIKLKHDKQKRKKMKKPASKSESVSTGQIPSRISSGSSIESGNVRDNRDLREKIKAKTRQNYERMQDGNAPDLRQHRRPQDSYSNAGTGNRNYNKTDIRDESPASSRRRRASGSSSLFEDKPLKRRRVLSPEEFAPSPRRAPPPNEQSTVGHALRRDRTPPSRDKMRVVQSPMRRAPLEDTRRSDVRSDINKRLDPYGDKGRDVDRFREDGSFSRDSLNRQKERVAPTRLGNMRHGSIGHQMTPDRERDRMGNERPGTANRFETRNRPLLQLPHSSPSVDQQKLPFRGSDDRVLRTSIQPQSPLQTKHSPMIVKSKEALIEKYRGMKQSQYVDMWVDKTVEAISTPSTIMVSPPKDNPPPSSRTFDDSVETGTKASSMKDIGELLSDFSDDADELLNDVGDEPKSEKSEKETTAEDKAKEVVAATAPVPDQDVASVGDAASQPEKNQTQVTTPTATSVLSQDRKSLSTPQRSFLECSREGQSLPSQSQTEDDILERMDFEEISDEELGDVAGENKIPIVDALGVDWASLVCGEKVRPVSPSSVMSAASTSQMKVRKRWTPIQVISQVGLVNNCSERLLQRVVELKMNEDVRTEGSSPPEDPLELEEKLQDELQNAGKLRKMRARSNVIDTIGLGPNSRALSSRRDMALRRYYLGMPQKSLVSMDLLHQNTSSSGVQDMDSIGELYRLSLSLFKGSDTTAVAV